MKKIFALILALLMILSFASCANKESPSKAPEEESEGKEAFAVPLGGNLKDLIISGVCFGKDYTEQPLPEGYDYTGLDIHIYYCEGSNTPYIMTSRFNKEGMTLEDIANYEADVYGNSVQYFSWDKTGYNDIGVTADVAYYNCWAEDENGDFYYDAVFIIEDGEDFVEIRFEAASEEVRLGDTEWYMWVPKGYNDHNTDELIKEYNTYFFGDYPTEYYFPGISVCKITDSYKFAKWFWEEDYPELPITEEQYNKWKETGWTDETSAEYGEIFGFENMYVASGEIAEGVNTFYLAGDVKGTYTEMMYVEINGEWYSICTGAAYDNPPKYETAYLASLHKKDDGKVTELNIGGAIGTMDLNKPSLGEYTVCDMPEWFYPEDGDTHEVYYSEDSDTPYIFVITHNKDGETLEEYTKKESETWSSGYYQMNDGWSYYTGLITTEDGTIYYTANNIFELDDCFKIVLFLAKTEEVQICDSDMYVNIPTGYTDEKFEMDDIVGGCICAMYDESRFFPNVYICNDLNTYDLCKLYFEDIFGEWNITKEQFDKWENWDKEDTIEFFEAAGYEYIYSFKTEENGITASVYCLNCDTASSKYDTFIFVSSGDKWYVINTYTMLTDPIPSYAPAIVSTIHTK